MAGPPATAAPAAWPRRPAVLAWSLAFPYLAPPDTGTSGIPEHCAARFILFMLALGLAIGAGAAVWKDAAGRGGAFARAGQKP